MKTEKFIGGYLEWMPVYNGKTADTIDEIPNPSVLGVDSYNYISYLWVDEKDRGKGKATEAIKKLISKTKKSILILLYDYEQHTGFILKKTLRRLGFKCPAKWRSEFPDEFCYMFLRR